jgi:hypothetical protein
MKFMVTAKQLLCYEFIIEADSLAEADKILAERTIDHDTLEHQVNVISWEEPHYLEMTPIFKKDEKNEN